MPVNEAIQAQIGRWPNYSDSDASKWLITFQLRSTRLSFLNYDLPPEFYLNFQSNSGTYTSTTNFPSVASPVHHIDKYLASDAMSTYSWGPDLANLKDDDIYHSLLTMLGRMPHDTLAEECQIIKNILGGDVHSAPSPSESVSSSDASSVLPMTPIFPISPAMIQNAEIYDTSNDEVFQGPVLHQFPQFSRPLLAPQDEAPSNQRATNQPLKGSAIPSNSFSSPASITPSYPPSGSGSTSSFRPPDSMMEDLYSKWQGMSETLARGGTITRKKTKGVQKTKIEGAAGSGSQSQRGSKARKSAATSTSAKPSRKSSSFT
ncbi:hypothetical protein GALMADRAFT_161661 [Galerina marginata CBS 339.88]|uniref:Uncharacterized protein n=1 Tax=Galerina marginata (strain CBS 339.88) TaxID=685588 RepID=A0A067SI77_GALM3|nr:hypothetical protein GALMADRAFT_161661 [Galerina marginata CBS 339.88]